MLATILSGALLGVDAYPVEVEVDVYPGVPGHTVVGLPDSAVKESVARVKSAALNSGYPFPARRITVNLAPADLKKEGSGFDLPIALGLLAALELIPVDRLTQYMYVGELSLDGTVKPVHGALSLALAARDLGLKGLFLPEENAAEASVVEGVEVYGVGSLLTIAAFLVNRIQLEPATPLSMQQAHPNGLYLVDLKDVRGQEHAKRALEVAAAGGHNILLIGPPGSGKTMMAKRLPTILPSPIFEELLETTKVYSSLGMVGPNDSLIRNRPFRAPHHTISDAGLIGGGRTPKPGEVSLAHNGVLFLDELPEFRKNVLEALRQPVEEGKVTISRSQISLTFPARFMLAAAMNPCPCGYRGDSAHECKCGVKIMEKYWSKISGPLLDRIDIQIEAPPVKWRELTAQNDGESSEAVRLRVEKARELQLKRLKGLGVYSNAQMNEQQVKKICVLDSHALSVLEKAVSALGLSARAYHRILKISRTIADLSEQDRITSEHVAEAIQYRSLDRRMF